MTVTDEPGVLRDEDSFDTAAVHAWLAERADGLRGLPEVRQYAGGASNLTYLLRYPDRDLILRRPPRGHKAASAHDMRREVRVQTALRPVFPYVPTVLGLCDDHTILGSDFYVMERVPGIIVRQDLPEGLDLTADQAHDLAHHLIDRLVELHQVDPDEAGLTDLGRGRGYVGRQVRGWSSRFTDSWTDNAPDFDDIMAWLHDNQPDDVATCVIHNDWRLDNVVLDDGADPSGTLRIVGVLDWEMSTLGDPLMELGGVAAYWTQADDDEVAQLSRKQPSHLPGMPTRTELVAYYCERAGLSAENWPFYLAFGYFRLAVVIQQLYYRYHHGQTTNPAYRDLWMFVGYLRWRADRVIAGEAS